jgi:hypothetical protein
MHGNPSKRYFGYYEGVGGQGVAGPYAYLFPHS